MPELPEVETTVRGLAPVVLGQRIARVLLRRAMPPAGDSGAGIALRRSRSIVDLIETRRLPEGDRHGHRDHG